MRARRAEAPHTRVVRAGLPLEKIRDELNPEGKHDDKEEGEDDKKKA